MAGPLRMIGNSQLTLPLLLVVVFAGCSSPSGGYSKADVADPDIVAAAQFAIREKSQQSQSNLSLIAIENAETQPVGLTNYKLTLHVSENDKERRADVKVWKTTEQDAAGDPIRKLSSWVWQ